MRRRRYRTYHLRRVRKTFTVYFKGRENELLSVVDSIFASGYLTADGQGSSDTMKTITDAGFVYEIESD